MRVDAVFRGRITTWDPGRPQARALAVHGGRVVAFDDDAEALARDAAVTEDFGTATLLPGFHDAHCHTTAFGVALADVDLSTPPVTTMEQLYAAVAERAAATPAGEWVTGSGYDQNKLGGRHPERRRLDEAAGGRPVWLSHTSGHMCVVNTAALERIGTAVDAPVEGGRVALDAGGEPTGLLEEQAQRLVQDLVLPRSLAAIEAAIGRAHERYLAEGLTSVCDAGVAGGWIGQSPIELAAYQRARESGRLRVRTTVMLASDALVPIAGHADDRVDAALGLPGGIRTGLGDEWLRIGPVKVFSDGSLIGRTCWMDHGFADDPANTGYPQADPERLRAVIVGAHRGGWQVATHAIGDAAVSFVLDCYEEALEGAPRPDHRHRIEHCGITTPASLRRLAHLGVVPVPQGRFVGEIGDGMARAVGADRVADTYRLRSFLQAGVLLPGSSDRPVVDGRPLLGVRDMARRVTESGAPFATGEALTVEEALRAYSLGSAAAERSEHQRGALRLGQLADVVVLADDPRRVPVDDVADVPVVATVVGGVVAHDAR